MTIVDSFTFHVLPKVDCFKFYIHNKNVVSPELMIEGELERRKIHRGYNRLNKES